MYRSSMLGRRAGGILVAMGVLELALAAGLWLFLGDIPYAGGAMKLTAGILGLTGLVLLLVGLVLLRRAAAADRVSTTGLAGTGQIMGLTQTGMFVNENPQVAIDLLVQVMGRSPYRVTVKEVVPLILLSRLQGTVPVRVDQANPDRVFIQWDQAGAAAPASQAGFGSGGPGSGRDETLAQVAAALAATGRSDAAPVFAEPGQAAYSVEQLRAYLRANGIAGTARIDRLEDSGQTVGDERLFTMTTTVTVPGRATVTTGPSAAMVPLEKVGRVAVGVVLPVKVAPDNEHMVMFEWDRI